MYRTIANSSASINTHIIRDTHVCLGKYSYSSATVGCSSIVKLILYQLLILSLSLIVKIHYIKPTYAKCYEYM